MFSSPHSTVNFEIPHGSAAENDLDDTPDFLDEFASSSHSVRIDFSPLDEDLRSADIEPEIDITADPQYLELVRMIMDGIEIDLPRLPVNPALKNNKNHTLSLGNELERYFSILQEKLPIRTESLQEKHARLTPAKAPVNNLKCAVAIPVAGHQEAGNIYRTLQQFASQDMPADQFEVILYLNLPADEDADTEALSKDARNTIAEITRFKQDHPDMQVRYMTNAYRIQKPLIGEIRSDLWDMISYDMMQRGRTDDIPVVSADADIIHLNNCYLSELVSTWQESGADFVTANLRWQPAPGLPYDATTNKLLRYQTFLDSVRDNRGRFLHTADANTAVSLAMYLAIGGYNRDLQLGEMYDLVTNIRYYRGWSHDTESYEPGKTVEAKATKAYLKTHSRRLIKAMALGRAPYDAWDQRLITFGTDDEVRTAEAESDLAEMHAAALWKKWVLRQTPFYVKDVSLGDKRRILKQARLILGFDDLYKQ